MGERILPTESGWWWAQWDGDEPRPTYVWWSSGLGWVADDQTWDRLWPVSEPRWTWLAPIPSPDDLLWLRNRLARLEYRSAQRPDMWTEDGDGADEEREAREKGRRILGEPNG